MEWCMVNESLENSDISQAIIDFQTRQVGESLENNGIFQAIIDL